MADDSGKGGNKGTLWAGAAGALDPWLVNLAQKLAAKTPADSPLRSVAVGTIAGIIKGIIESKSSSLPTPLKIAVEKATDFGDFFAGALGASHPTAPQVEDWMKKFFAEAGKRLQESQNPQAEFDRIKMEFQLRKELLEMIRQESEKDKPPAPPVTPPVDWGKELKRLQKRTKKLVREHWPTVKNKLGEYDQKAADRIDQFRLSQKWIRK